MINITSKDSEKLKPYLPDNYLALIAAKINHAICIRQIRFVIKGEQKDKHGVIDALITIAAENKAKLELQKMRMKQFSKK